MFSIFLNFSLNTLLISIATKKTKKRETNRCFDQHRLNERFPPTHIRKSWNGKKKKKGSGEKKGKERKDRRRRCKSPDMVWYRGERRVARVQGPLRNDR